MSPTFLVLAALPLVLVGALLLARKPIRRHLFGDGVVGELAAVRADSRSLTWRERWTISRALARGRSAPAHLQGFAARGAKSRLHVIDRLESSPWFRWIYRRRYAWICAGLFGLLAAGNIGFLLFADADIWPTLFQAATQVGLMCLWFSYGPVLRRQKARFRQALTANGGEQYEAVADEDPAPNAPGSQ